MAEPIDPLPDPVLRDRFTDAFAYAVHLHALQARKATAIPYVTHLMSVCSLVLEDGGDEDQAVAALLHDGPEDQGGQPVLDDIRLRFGDQVAALVDGLSDTLEDPKPPWGRRKVEYLARLMHEPTAVLAGGQTPQPALRCGRPCGIGRGDLGSLQCPSGPTALVLLSVARCLRAPAARLAQPPGVPPLGGGGVRGGPEAARR